MRRVIVSWVVLALMFVLVSQASAFGWRWTRHHSRHHRTAATASVVHHVQAATMAAPAAPIDAVKPGPAAQMDESAALAQVVEAMRGMLQREHERLERKLKWLEEDEDDSSSYGSD